ncbi:MAG: fused MFS/spermidine synthase [Prosthecobacter sp.]|jgi:spermidine synthase|uniref:fused MFS/spermidine synthase n=1 Tax=Prosthecobacter sp. TaxID=1965333 RepID=UPI0019EC08A3|nr:fused MFS/spermidine synthase [Prosthecobacter sp.]MBE2285759.1 fused MFS/spermidine synthase [Prosthecobacter sp.]
MPRRLHASILHGVFILSGISALIYQLVWQRALLTIYGSNVESVAMVVAAFLAGLGIGSLFGGWISKSTRAPLVLLFGLAELGVGAYGLVSLKLFDTVGAITSAQAHGLTTGVLVFLLVFLPTLLMGATLPMLVAHQVRDTAHVGQTVSRLYFVNTLGAALGAFIAAKWLLGGFGMRGTVHIAASLNALAALIVLIALRKAPQASDQPATSHIPDPSSQIPFPTALWWSALSGFLALSWEIIWSRVFNFASASRAPVFGYMLGSYLLGLALGSLFSQRLLAKAGGLRLKFGRWVLLSSVCAFMIAPITAIMAAQVHWEYGFILVVAAGMLLGITFPLLCQAAIPPSKDTGSQLSRLYLANIIGSGAGSLLTGFLFMEWTNLQLLSVLLLLVSWLWAESIGRFQLPHKQRWQPLCVMAVSLGTFQGFYERLQYKHDFNYGMSFAQTIESRHGVITVDTSGAVYGNGAYDGMIGTKLEPKSWLVRPYFLSAVHDRIENVLVIGVASGSWTQILVNHPQVKKVTAIELSHGYLDLIRSRPEVASLLTNPKLELVIDDGRRWLRQHPEAKFDAIVMNTTHHWREFASALLSREFLTEVKAHLTPDGIAFWNCTESPRAARTGMDVFPHTMMVMNHCLASNAPLEPNRDRWQKILADYRIDGQPVIAADQIEGVLTFLDVESLPVPGDMWHWCRREAMQQAWGKAEVITDDNLGHEYR